MAGTTRVGALCALVVGLLALAPQATAVSSGALTLQGTVRDASAAAVVGATVRVCDPAPPHGNCLPSATTGAGGTYTLAGLPQGESMEFEVVPLSTSGLIPQSNGLTLGGNASNYDVTLQRGAVAGFVRDAGGQPVAGVAVDLYPCSAAPPGCFPSGSATSGADGYYAVGAGQATGTYRVGTNSGGANGWFDSPDMTVSVTAGATTAQNLVVVAGGLVQGTVTDASHTPVAGAQLFMEANSVTQFVGTTNAAGQYSTGPRKPGVYTLTVNPQAPFARASQLVTVTSGVTSTVDFVLVRNATVTVHVFQANGTPYPSSALSGAGACPTPADLPACAFSHAVPAGPTGTATLLLGPGTWDVFAGTQNPLAISSVVTVTLAAGDSVSCTFLGAAGTCATADDADGVSAATENGGPNGGDGNSDGVPDANQTNVTSLPSSGPGAPYATIAGPSGTSLTNVTAIDPTTLPPPPAGALLPVGVLNFEVHGIAVGAAIDVKVYVPTGTNPTTYLKNRLGVWSDFTSNASFAGDVVTLHLVDGAAGDSDGVANGVIVDPGAPGISSFGGFLSPVAAPPAVNSQKAGSAVPIKFSLGGNRGMNIFAAGWPKSQTVPCGSNAPVNGTDSTETPGNSSLQYDSGSKTYSINWKTNKAWAGTCRQLVLKFTDGSTFRANFNFK